MCCFPRFFNSKIINVTAIIKDNPSATGPANNTPLIPNNVPSIIKAGTSMTICLESDNIALLMLFR